VTEPCHGDPPLRQLPLVALYLSERCNSRCITCDYWRNGSADLNAAQVESLLPTLAALGTRVVLISGGEPLLNPQWPQIARLLKEAGLKVWLLTSGLSLAKHSQRAAELFDAITVSLDGTRRRTYAEIRGLDAFEPVVAGLRAAAGAGAFVSVRVTLQRANFRELAAFVDLAHAVGARQVSFLAVEVANRHSFGRRDGIRTALALSPEDLPHFEHQLKQLERDYAHDFQSRFIAESPQKMQRILQYFAALCGLAPYPPVRCNAPEFSAVIGAQGDVHPCFFIPGPAGARIEDDLGRALNGRPMRELREEIRLGRRAECATCVCSMWREPGSLEAADFLPRPILESCGTRA
jgi:Fe-coproporphyrin III synthase